ncbi:putative bifunctional diguanylate cyclase/phosphodiesterase [Pseudarthrobacter sp. NS4]|uniref:putative bifunctional diguanylate cyclase/phosphodiesterase n=1 Tax=Pseudarthrobacter sp. NS4 TaxID=2973976 RepID=UPI0021630C9B|nr:bifunctional diguanylate cyclase/phosphodiesterase [Pseudarthrobacter sp. NS4]
MPDKQNPWPYPLRSARALKPSTPTLGDLGFEAMVLRGDTPSGEIEALFRADRGLRAVVVEVKGELALLTRDQLDHRMTGRLGYGRALNARATAEALLPRTTFRLPPSLDLRAAAAALLDRPEESRYQDVLVVPASGAPRVVPVSQVFEGLSDVFRHAAVHDPLTGLANRLGLEESWQALLTGNGSTRTAALYIDLDDFKVINNTFGHRAGDSVLTAFAARLKACTKPADRVARLGGDEFAVLLADVDETMARTLADHILHDLNEPFAHDGHALRVSATLGLAMASDVDADGQGPGTHLEDLLRQADAAMLQAKHEGKRRLGRIDPSQPASHFARQALIRRRLPHALSNAGFSLRYQPLMDIPTGSCHAVEALLRWEDPELGAVSPDEFIHVAEHTGMIHAVGRWVIDEACAQARAWEDAGTPRAISVNISPLQLAAGSLVTDIRASLQRHGVPTSLLNIEITESAAIVDLPSAAAQLRTLIDSGIGVDLDDYGTAYSSLSLLRELPLTGLKLDKSFIDAIDTDPTSAILVAGVIAPAKALGLKTTAEGVERETQLAVLRELGCDTAQGYLISRPLAAADCGKSWPAGPPRRAGWSA